VEKPNNRAVRHVRAFIGLMKAKGSEKTYMAICKLTSLHCDAVIVSQERLAHEAGVSESTVKRHLKDLSNTGKIHIRKLSSNLNVISLVEIPENTDQIDATTYL